MTLKSIKSHLDGNKYLVHMYALPVESGMEAMLPDSEFMKKFVIRIFFGSKVELRTFISDTLGVSTSEMEY